jgi:hypothetical protein
MVADPARTNQHNPPLACSHCQTPLTREALQAAAPRFDSVASALIDHLMHIETTLAEVKRLVEGVVL